MKDHSKFVNEPTNLSESRHSLSSLLPNHSFFSFYSPKFKSEHRNEGSFLLATKTPSKQTAYSRPYQHGDPTKLIDWRAYARTDQLLLREEHHHNAARIAIVLEDGDSMWWPDSSLSDSFGQALTLKSDIAQRIALNLCYLHIQAGDSTELILYDAHREGQNPFRKVLQMRTTIDVLTLFKRCQKALGTKEQLASIPQTRCHNPTSMDRVYWIGDRLHAPHSDQTLSQNKKTCVINTLSSLEVDISWLKDDICYFGHSLQSKDHLGRSLRVGKSYERSLDQWIKTQQSLIEESRGHYFLVTERTPITKYSGFLHSIIKE